MISIPYLVRNMVLGFIEHLTIQWLLLGRPEEIAVHTDTIFQMVMRAVEKEDEDTIEVKLRSEQGNWHDNMFGSAHAVHLRESDKNNDDDRT